MAIYGSDPRAYFEFIIATDKVNAETLKNTTEIGRLIQIQNTNNPLDNDNYKIYRVTWDSDTSQKILEEVIFPRPLTALRFVGGDQFDNYYLKDGELGYYDSDKEDYHTDYPLNNYTPIEGDIVLANYIPNEGSSSGDDIKGEFVFIGEAKVEEEEKGHWELLGDENIYVTKNSNANLNSLNINNGKANILSDGAAAFRTGTQGGNNFVIFTNNQQKALELSNQYLVSNIGTKFNGNSNIFKDKLIIGDKNTSPNTDSESDDRLLITSNGNYGITIKGIYNTGESESDVVNLTPGRLVYNRGKNFFWNKNPNANMYFGFGDLVASNLSTLILNKDGLQIGNNGATFTSAGASRLQDSAGSNERPVYINSAGKPEAIELLKIETATFTSNGASRLQNPAGDNKTPVFINSEGKAQAVNLNYSTVSLKNLITSGQRVGTITINDESFNLFADSQIGTIDNLIDYTNFDGSTYLVWEGGNAQDSDRIETIFDAQNENDF